MPTELAFVFPGQGSQSIGMLTALSKAQPEVESTFSAASEALGYDLWSLVQQGPERALMATERTQPAMLAAGVAVWRVWRSLGGPLPSVMAGHSLGEYTSLVCAGALDFCDAVTLVADRGRLMQEAVPHGIGAIAAILGLPDDKVHSVCRIAAEDEVIAPVNFNAPGQVVVAGHTAAVERALKLAQAIGAKRTVVLPMSVPAHSPLMRVVTDRFAERLAAVKLTRPSIPVIHNADVAVHPDAHNIREALGRQLSSPVRWTETVQTLARRGVKLVVECGPGKVLAALCKRIDRGLTALPAYDVESLKKALDQTAALLEPTPSLNRLSAALGYTGA
ncbi:MAG: ACP S-malonyltransferase [Gammaproteobacteria bacterium]|jgi:[acyl-carrier-protein] S-malonyltransferase